MSPSKATCIHWFRKGLRLTDNPALTASLEHHLELRPIYILDPWFVQNYKVGENRCEEEDAAAQSRRVGECQNLPGAQQT